MLNLQDQLHRARVSSLSPQTSKNGGSIRLANYRPATHTDFLTLKFGKIQIFPPKIKGNRFFYGMVKVFPKILIFLVINTDFV